MLDKGDDLISKLYFWRSLSKPVEPALSRQDLGQAKKQEILQHTLELLKPAIRLCQEILTYNENYMKLLSQCIDMSEKSLSSDEPVYILLNFIFKIDIRRILYNIKQIL